MNKIIAIVGMPGSGKTEVADILAKRGFGFVRLGQLTLDEIKERGLEPTETNERQIRERIRKEHGMAAYAILNFLKIGALLKKGGVVIDGLYSWEEYLAFKKKYGNNFCILAVYASPSTRYQRLEKQKIDKSDKALKRRHFTIEQAKSRDKAEIENLNKGGPIAMADFTIINESTKENLKKEVENIIKNWNALCDHGQID